MKKKHIYILIHSPLVGTLTWKLVAEQMLQRGFDVIVPMLSDSPDSKEPYWKQHAESFSQELANISGDPSVILIAHSGAGPLLPALRQSIPNPVHAYVFVDAGIPHNTTRLDMMKSEESDWAEQFQKFLEGGERFPNWSSEDLSEILPDKNLREQLVAEIRPRGLDFFTEPIPVFDGWPDAPCAYILFSPPYKRAELEARQKAWRTYELEAGHFHMLVDAPAVTAIIVEAINNL